MKCICQLPLNEYATLSSEYMNTIDSATSPRHITALIAVTLLLFVGAGCSTTTSPQNDPSSSKQEESVGRQVLSDFATAALAADRTGLRNVICNQTNADAWYALMSRDSMAQRQITATDMRNLTFDPTKSTSSTSVFMDAPLAPNGLRMSYEVRTVHQHRCLWM